MKKLLVLFLAFVMLFAVVACGGKGSGNTETTNVPGGTTDGTTTDDTTTAPPETTEGDILGFLPEDIYYEGETITVLQQGAYGDRFGNEVAISFEDLVPGNQVQESVYERNQQVKDRLGVTIETVFGSAWNSWHSDLYTSVFTNDGAYDAVCGAYTTAYKCAVQGTIINLNDLDSIDLSHEWWDQNQIASMSFGPDKHVYMIAGDINFYDNYATSCLFFNTTMFNSLLPDAKSPYDLVRDDEWTLDIMLQYCQNVYSDVDGSTTNTYEDQYGFACNYAFNGRMLNSFGISLLTLNENNWPIINDDQRIVDIFDDLLDRVVHNNNVWIDNGEYAGIFFANRALFMEDNLAALVDARTKMQGADLGVLPYAKYDENQEDYCNPVNDAYGTVYGIVRTADWEMVGYVLDTMGACSVDTVTEAVINKNVFVQATRDEDCEDMLRIIFGSAYYPFEAMANYGYINSSLPMNIVLYDNNNYISEIARIREGVEIQIEEDMTKLFNPEF